MRQSSRQLSQRELALELGIILILFVDGGQRVELYLGRTLKRLYCVAPRTGGKKTCSALIR